MAAQNPMRRLIKLPGVKDVEEFWRLGLHTSNDARSLEDRCNALTKELFGITRDDTLFVAPPEYQDGTMPFEDRWDVDAQRADHEAQFVTEAMGFDEDKVEFLLHFGWDLRDDRGQPLEITRYICRVIEAVARGVAGSAPSSEVIETQSWGQALEQAAAEFKKKKRPAT